MQNPTTVVIFGITGDLSRKKVVPSLFYLWKRGMLGKGFKIVGFSRREFTNESIRQEIKKFLPESESEQTKQKFLSMISYKQGIFDDLASYESLREYLEKSDKKVGGCSNKLFYFAVPPNLYEIISEHIYKSGLSIPCGGAEGWSRILIEKPFGNDLKTAESLDKLLGKLFKEEQIYRIDHYLGKETLQNILTFRFSNMLFEPLWNKKHIEKVEINLFEKSVVGERGAFYDETGALRDVGQNHLLQMLALVAMEKPQNLSSSQIRIERAKVLKKLSFQNNFPAVKAQYEGYVNEKGVKQNSKTETFFRIGANISDSKWRGVPFILTSGKGLKENKAEIKIYFKDPDPKSYLPEQFAQQEHNCLTFRIQPDEGISVLFWVKVPGFEKRIEPKNLAFNYADSGVNIPDAYERVLYDCIVGDQTLFPTTNEILSQWSFIEKAILKLRKLPPKTYKIGDIL